ncbi:MAG: DsrE family protein [Gammaproteobacteria bacterium SHHR-1]|uniref:DsrE family protein n=1 Tax=Magnetovirga frankeli TaxID=947516 RepID=UPI0012935721|nr:DsrE family protein [gamma proteobacterium SS-5]
MNSSPIGRRHLLRCLAGLGLAAALPALAHHTETHMEDDSLHHVVFQCNKADDDYLGHVLFSAGEMIRKYGDDVEVVISCSGAGLHLLGKKPGRPVAEIHQQRAASLATYGVAFHACGNTLEGLGWSKEDLLPFAKVVPIGAVDLMLLQERGFAYISW